MCGIAGLMTLTGKPLDDPWMVERMMERLVHRGPDEAGIYIDRYRQVSLGHRRLRIIDLATGRQPLGNEDGTVMLVFNGEIYGFQGLRVKLEQKGHRFSTATDTEVIAHLYEECGSDCVSQLKGMFAFAIWDERANSLLLARDQMGKKPLYYAIHEGTFIFASEILALLAVPGLAKDIDKNAIDTYLTLGYIPAPHTIYHGIRKLEAGHSLLIKEGEVRQTCYWRPRVSPSEHSDAISVREDLITRLREATSVRMVSDVPIGCFLSGGIDSSAVLSFMAELSTQPVKTFSIGFGDPSYDELNHARLVARHFGTDHHELILEPSGIEVLDKMVRHFGEPFADPSALPTWYLSEMTARSVRVVLSGDGGDEVFGGYNWYRTAKILECGARIPQTVLNRLGNLSAWPWRWAQKIGKASSIAALPQGERYGRLRLVVGAHVKSVLYDAEFLRQTESLALGWLIDQYTSLQVGDPIVRAMAADLVTYMPEDLLVKVDRMSMAHSLECRSPFLDAELVEWGLGLPIEYHLNWRLGKLLLRDILRSRIPEALISRPKHGFEVPIAKWLQQDFGSLVKERLFDGAINSLEIFREDGLRSLVREHSMGIENNEQILYALLVLATWLQEFNA